LEDIARNFSAEKDVAEIIRKPLQQTINVEASCATSVLMPSPGMAPMSVEGNGVNPWKEIYMAQFSGLQSYGKTGMTVLEELIEAALQACDNARKTCPNMGAYYGAALLTKQGRAYTGCSLESTTNPLLNVTAERTAILKAISDGT